MGCKNKKLIIFDFDGTLVDSMGTFTQIAAQVMNDIYSTPLEKARRLYIETSGLPFFMQLEQIFPKHEANKRAAELFESEKIKNYYEQKVYPDASGTISQLRKRNIKVAVSSNNFQRLVDTFLEKAGIEVDFSLGFRTEAFCKGRGHIEYLLKETGYIKADLIFVGDSLKDSDKAADCHIDFIGKTGLFTEEEFNNHMPGTKTIHRLEQLTDLL